MTVKELIEELKVYTDDYVVVVRESCDDPVLVIYENNDDVRYDTELKKRKGMIYI